MGSNYNKDKNINIHQTLAGPEFHLYMALGSVILAAPLWVAVALWETNEAIAYTLQNLQERGKNQF